MVKRDGGRTVYPPDPASPLGKIIIRNGRVIDPANGIDEQRTVCIDNGRIVAVDRTAPKGFTADREIDAAGMWITPGLVDMHVHLREPGREDKETLFTGTCAAAAGGFTAVACMPNTTPALDEESKIRYVKQHGERCPCRIYPIGAITKALAGEELAPFGEMVRAGACAMSDDGMSVARSDIMRNALNYSKSFDIPIVCHCEDSTLTQGGHMNESTVSARLGVYGMPAVAEDIIVARDIMLAEYTGARVHIAHVSTAGSVALVRQAKQRGARVTAETCPHYVALTDEALNDYDTNKKMNPPLRTERDRQAVTEALADGTIDVLASDHAPHVPEDKDVEFNAAAFGVIGLETALGVALTKLVAADILVPSDMVERMSLAPSRILRLESGTLSVGAAADVTVIDPRPSWTPSPDTFFSKARNTPFVGVELRGYAQYTILGGRIVYERNEY
ncbi:MAG: amidohydrolase family protein [Chitinivibrionales bacterium]|nr:amidohydrolase family protein [Chitinivibrionales bacterium]